MPRFIVTTVHDCGCGEIEVEARDAKEAGRIARSQSSIRCQIGTVRKVGDKHTREAR